MKKLAFPIICFLLAIVAGYSNELVPRVYDIFSDKLVFIGNLSKFEVPCLALGRSTGSECKKAYLVPNPSVEILGDGSVALGFVLRGVGVKCINNEQYIDVFDSLENPGTDRAESNKYKVLNLSKYKCEQILIEAWSQKNDQRYGWIGGQIFYGSTEDVKKVVKAIDFYANDFRLVVACFLLLVSLFGFITRIRYHSSVEKFNFELAVPFFAFVSLLNSGTIGKVIPVFESSFFQNSLSIFLSTVGTFVAIFGIASNYKLLRFFLFIALLVVSVSSYSSSLVGPINIALSFIGIGICIFYKKNISTFLFSVLVVLASLKLMGVSSLPHSHVHMIFLGTIVFWNFSKLTAKILNYNKFLIIENRAVFQNNEFICGLLKIISEDLSANRISLFSIIPGSGCKVYSHTKANGFKEYNLDELPPIIAHAVSAGDNIWHLDAFSEEFKIIKKSFPSEAYKGRFVTILPLFSGGSIVGALAITDYASIVNSEIIEKINFRVLSQLASKVLSEILKSYQMSINDEKNEILSVVTANLSEASVSSERVSLFLDKSIEITASGFGCRGFIAKLDHDTRALLIQSTFGYDATARSLLANIQFYAYKDNFHGPAPLAINSKKPVVVEDINWLASVVKSKTSGFF